MSNTPQDLSSEENKDTTTEEHDYKDSIFFKKLENDVWEAWTWTAVGLAATALMVWGVAYLKLGYVSVLVYGVGIPLTMLMSVPIVLWGLFKSTTNPPVMRTSRSIGFVCVFATSLAAVAPEFPAPVSTEDFVSQHVYRPPFTGEWYTISGGLEKENNYNVTAPALRFAYTFTRLTKEGSRFEGDESVLESYPCFGSDVLSPTEGEVVSVYNTQNDNVPGQPSSENMLGNHIVIKVDTEEYVIANFLKKESIPVEVGATVKTGDKIGECGNSGGASLPQFQIYLVTDGTKLVLTEGVPMPFEHYSVIDADGKEERVVKGMPKGSGSHDDLQSGQTVKPYNP